MSGNPNGRYGAKETIEVVRAAREYGMEALLKLVNLMREARSDKIQLAAAVAILDRVLGKPAVSVHVTAEARFELLSVLVGLTPEQRAQRMAELERSKP